MNSIELFSPTGGLALGLQISGFEHSASYEWDEDSCNNLKFNILNGYPTIKNWNVFQADVRGFLRKSFSSYFNYILLQLQHPKVIKAENMTWQEHLSLLEKHHTSGKEQGFSYNVVFRLLNAADYCVPQIATQY